MDLYELLGLARGATLIEIKRSYRRLARKYHPDINPGDYAAEAHFKEITYAYETLTDPERRTKYDGAGYTGGEGADGVAFAFEGFDFSAGQTDAGGTIRDLFADVFTERNRSRSAAPQPGADLHQSLTLAFDESIHGVQRQVTLTRFDLCRSCQGAGQHRIAERNCSQCQGSGTLRSRHGSMVFSRACETCGGTGRITAVPCEACGGAGQEARTETIAVRIPAGVSDGSRIRVPEKGHAGLRGGRPGDLYITVRVQSHEMFRRDGNDLFVVVPVAVHEAALGAKIEVPAPDGVARVRVPPGTQSGQRFRVRGRGAPSPRNGERGDLVVEVKLVLPRVLDERSKELLREFGRINGEDVRK